MGYKSLYTPLDRCVTDVDIIFLPCSFFFFLFSCLFSSANLSRGRLDVYYTFTHGVATYIRQGGHRVGHRPPFYFLYLGISAACSKCSCSVFRSKHSYSSTKRSPSDAVKLLHQVRLDYRRISLKVYLLNLLQVGGGKFVILDCLSVCKERKGKEEYLYSAFSHQGTYKALRHGSHSFTCKQHHACLCSGWDGSGPCVSIVTVRLVIVSWWTGLCWEGKSDLCPSVLS